MSNAEGKCFHRLGASKKFRCTVEGERVEITSEDHLLNFGHTATVCVNGKLKVKVILRQELLHNVINYLYFIKDHEYILDVKMKRSLSERRVLQVFNRLQKSPIRNDAIIERAFRIALLEKRLSNMAIGARISRKLDAGPNIVVCRR